MHTFTAHLHYTCTPSLGHCAVAHNVLDGIRIPYFDIHVHVHVYVYMGLTFLVALSAVFFIYLSLLCRQCLNHGDLCILLPPCLFVMFCLLLCCYYVCKICTMFVSCFVNCCVVYNLFVVMFCLLSCHILYYYCCFYCVLLALYCVTVSWCGFALTTYVDLATHYVMWMYGLCMCVSVCVPVYVCVCLPVCMCVCACV